MNHPYKSLDFEYANWNARHEYVCVDCEEEENRIQPPVGVIERIGVDGSPDVVFVALCWRHMADEAVAWVRFIKSARPDRGHT